MRLSRLYTQLCFCFQLLDNSEETKSSILALLSNGLERLSENFPCLASQIVDEDGILNISSFEMTPRMVVKDVNSELPSMGEIQRRWLPVQHAG